MVLQQTAAFGISDLQRSTHQSLGLNDGNGDSVNMVLAI